MRVTRRRLLAVAILVVWAGVVATQVRLEYFRPLSERLEIGAAMLAPGTVFYLARMGDAPVGLATSRLDTVPDGFVAEDRLILDVPVQGGAQRAVAHTRVELTRALGLREFLFDLDSDAGRFAVTGEARGDTILEVAVSAGSGAERSTLRLDDGLVLPTVLPLRLAAGGGLRVGESRRLRLFDPSTLSGREIELRVAAHDTLLVADTATWDGARREWVPVPDTLAAWQLEERFGGIVVTSWVDRDGRLIRAESPLGITLERVPYEVVRAEWDRARSQPQAASGYGAIIESTAIASNVRLDGVGTTDRLRVRLAGVSLEGFDLAGGRQSVRGDTLVVEREDPAALDAGYLLPYGPAPDGRSGAGRGAGVGGPPTALESALESTPLIQAGDPRIIEAARRVASGERDPVVVARLLNDWVHRTLRKDLVPSVPSAVQVLEAGRGDCNEHTVLYVALARSLGLPARTAAGLVHLDGRFYYHAWPEVWLGEWVAVDPTLGQFPADASHLRFVVGGLARQVELIRLIGQLRVEVL